MEPRNLVELVLEYDAYLRIADMRDPDEIEGMKGLFSYYCCEKFTAEEKELICRIATEKALKLRERLRGEFGSAKEPMEAQRLQERQALEKHIAFYEAVPDTLYYIERRNEG